MSKTIMIVDDSASIRTVVGIALRGAGYAVIEGQRRPGRHQQAHRSKGPPHHQRREHAQHGRHHVRQERQADATYKFTPIIMLTTESDESKKREGQAAGAKAWVVKPFQPDQMLSAVQKLCACPERQARPTPNHDHPMSSEAHYDPPVALAHRGRIHHLRADELKPRC
jgi:two-component system chemotaxis response regulator CheY